MVHREDFFSRNHSLIWPQHRETCSQTNFKLSGPSPFRKGTTLGGNTIFFAGIWWMPKAMQQSDFGNFTDKAGPQECLERRSSNVDLNSHSPSSKWKSPRASTVFTEVSKGPYFLCSFWLHLAAFGEHQRYTEHYLMPKAWRKPSFQFCQKIIQHMPGREQSCIHWMARYFL